MKTVQTGTPETKSGKNYKGFRDTKKEKSKQSLKAAAKRLSITICCCLFIYAKSCGGC